MNVNKYLFDDNDNFSHRKMVQKPAETQYLFIIIHVAGANTS